MKLAILGLLAVGVSPAALIPFSDLGSSGTLASGQPWLLVPDSSTVDGGFRGLTVWGVPGLGAGGATWTGPGTLVGFEIEFTGLGQGVEIDQSADPDPLTFTDYTRFVFGSDRWTPTYTGLNKVRFDAAPGGGISDGGSFFVNVAFMDASVPTGGCNSCGGQGFGSLNFGSVNFNGNFITDVPEPSTFMLAGIGLGLLGLARRKR